MESFGEAEVREFLTENGLEARIYSFTESTENSYLAAQALGVELGQIVKTVMFLADGKPVLVLMSGDMNSDTKKLRKLLGAKKIRIADAETVLAATGYPVGAVPPVAHRQAMPTYLDESLRRFPKIYPAAGTTTNMFVTTFEQLLRLTKAQIVNVGVTKKKVSSSGFTLIELMIVIAIIGILAAIAIPQFSAYRKKAFNAAALSDLRNTRSVVEAYYQDYFYYPQ